MPALRLIAHVELGQAGEAATQCEGEVRHVVHVVEPRFVNGGQNAAVALEGGQNHVVTPDGSYAPSGACGGGESVHNRIFFSGWFLFSLQSTP